MRRDAGRQPETEAAIEQVLKFERFYSRRLRESRREGYANEVCAAEQRVLRELLEGSCSPSWLVWRLDIDSGYLARTLRNLHLAGFVASSMSWHDRRHREVSLTERGRTVAEAVSRYHADQIRRSIEDLPRRQRVRLAGAMAAIVEIFERDWLTNFVESSRQRRHGRARPCRNMPRS